MDFVKCPKCGSPDRCLDCGATLVRPIYPCFGGIRRPNVKCACGHTWRVPLKDLIRVTEAIDQHTALVARLGKEEAASRPYSRFR